MSFVLEIKENFGEFSTYTKKIKEEFSIAENLLTEISVLLDDTEKWAGQSHDKCVTTQKILKDYMTSVWDILGRFERRLDRLEKDKQSFEQESGNVRRWR